MEMFQAIGSEPHSKSTHKNQNGANWRQGDELSWWTWSGSNRWPLPCHGTTI